jgi:uncharacterized protein YciI
MIKFVALMEKSSEKTASNELLLEHVVHLKNLKKDNHLFICGPLANSNKVMQIILAGDIKEAEKYLQMDPFAAEGVFESYTIFELNEANDDNNWLLPGSL